MAGPYRSHNRDVQHLASRDPRDRNSNDAPSDRARGGAGPSKRQSSRASETVVESVGTHWSDTDTVFFRSSPLRPGEINNGGMPCIRGYPAKGCDVFATVFFCLAPFRPILGLGCDFGFAVTSAAGAGDKRPCAGLLFFGFRTDVVPARAAPP